MNEFNYTIAMHLASKGITDIPNEWRHEPTLQEVNGVTVAMIYAGKGIIPPKEWEHNPTIHDAVGYTVAMRLASRNILNIPE